MVMSFSKMRRTTLAKDRRLASVLGEKANGQREYVVPILLWPDSPLSFMEWLHHINTTLKAEFEERFCNVYTR
jgi:hypothetical protein